jgi:hypothetical protein
MARKKALPPDVVVAAPPNAPEGFDELLEAVLTLLRDYHPDGETKKKLDHLHAKKALALITAASYHLSHLPDNEYRKGILLEAASLMDALVRENEARRRGAKPDAPAEPDKTMH